MLTGRRRYKQTLYSPDVGSVLHPEEWKTWYQNAVPLADERFEEHLTRLKEEQAGTVHQAGGM